jgi:hypothetical protein
MHHYTFILGEGEEAIVKVVIALIVFVIWGIGALANVAKKAGQNRTKSPPPKPVSSSNVAIRKTLSTAMRPRTMAPAAVRQPVAAPRPPVAAPTPPPAPPLVFDAPPVILHGSGAPLEAVLVPDEQDLRDRLIWLEVLGKPLALREDF